MDLTTFLLLGGTFDAPAAQGRRPVAPDETRTGGRLRADGRIFRTEAGAPWRWRGVSAFQLLDRFAKGENLQPFFDAYRGFNILRVWPYVTWPGTGWESPDVAVVLAFLVRCQTAGFCVELTLLTDDDSRRLGPARALVAFLAQAKPANVVIEIGNEPTTHKHIDTRALKAACDTSGFLYSSGDYEDSTRFFGSYLTAHTPRDDEWPRKAHDLLEYHNGGGPGAPSDPAHHVPCVADEPAKPSDVRGNKEQDYLAYAGTCALLGAGATWHCETGKYAQLPTDEERRCATAFLQGLNAFPADAPNGRYRQPVEQSLRTYIVGGCMVRVRPTTKNAPEAGWRSLDPGGVLWVRK